MQQKQQKSLLNYLLGKQKQPVVSGSEIHGQKNNNEFKPVFGCGFTLLHISSVFKSRIMTQLRFQVQIGMSLNFRGSLLILTITKWGSWSKT